MTITLLVNPLSRPVLLADAAVETGAYLDAVETGIDLLLQQALSGAESDEVEPQRQSLTPDHERRVRSVLTEALTAEWLSTTVSTVAHGAEMWIAGGGRPPVTVDLTEPKQRMSDHPDSFLLAMALAEPDDYAENRPTRPDSPGANAAVDEFLAEIPDEAALHGTGWWDDVITRASDLRHWTLRVGLIAGGVALLAVAGGLVLARPPISSAVTSWGAWVALWVALPALTLAWAVPAIAGAVPFPEVMSLLIRIVEGSWDTTRLVGWISLATALCLWALTHVVRDRALPTPDPERPVGEPDRVLASVG